MCHTCERDTSIDRELYLPTANRAVDNGALVRVATYFEAGGCRPALLLNPIAVGDIVGGDCALVVGTLVKGASRLLLVC
jgi:hypothetical protein